MKKNYVVPKDLIEKEVKAGAGNIASWKYYNNFLEFVLVLYAVTIHLGYQEISQVFSSEYFFQNWITILMYVIGWSFAIKIGIFIVSLFFALGLNILCRKEVNPFWSALITLLITNVYLSSNIDKFWIVAMTGLGICVSLLLYQIALNVQISKEEKIMKNLVDEDIKPYVSLNGLKGEDIILKALWDVNIKDMDSVKKKSNTKDGGEFFKKIVTEDYILFAIKAKQKINIILFHNKNMNNNNLNNDISAILKNSLTVEATEMAKQVLKQVKSEVKKN